MNEYKISPQAIEILNHIFSARIDNSQSPLLRTTWASVRNIFEYALTDNLECLSQYDYLLTNDEKEKGW